MSKPRKRSHLNRGTSPREHRSTDHRHAAIGRKHGLDAFALKIIAIVTMTIDHIGTLIYPEALWLRVIGRLALPIIAFLLVEGYHNTRNLPRYLLRLLVFALIAQPIYRLVFPQGLNILFDLMVGLCVMWAADRLRSWWLRSALLAVVSGMAFVIGLDWWHLAVLIVFIFHATRGRFWHTTLALGALLVVNCLVFTVVSARTGDPSYQLINTINLACLLALPLLRRYNGKRGHDVRYFFYAFYPAHLLIIYTVMTALA